MDMGIVGIRATISAAAQDGILENGMLRIVCTTSLPTCALSWARVGTGTYHRKRQRTWPRVVFIIHGQRKCDRTGDPVKLKKLQAIAKCRLSCALALSRQHDNCDSSNQFRTVPASSSSSPAQKLRACRAEAEGQSTPVPTP